VNNGPFALQENYHQVWSGFSDLYNGPETIWAYQASANDGQANGDNANFGERLNFPHSGSPFGCCGFHQPAQNLVNFFKVDGNGLPLAMDDPSRVFDATAAWNAQDDEFDAAQNNVPVDPRLDWTVGRDGVPYMDWGPHESGWIRQESFGGPYSPKKNVHERAVMHNIPEVVGLLLSKTLCEFICFVMLKYCYCLLRHMLKPEIRRLHYLL
jgi:starch-binding outer membrane protein, SusD/RagB family